MKFNREVLNLERNHMMYQYTLGSTQMESSLAKKTLGIVVVPKLNINQ